MHLGSFLIEGLAFAFVFVSEGAGGGAVVVKRVGHSLSGSAGHKA